MADFNYIRFPQDIAPTSNIERSDKIIIAKVNGDTFVTTIARLSKIVGESGQRVEPVAPGELPYLDTLSERFMEVDLEGDYYFEGILLANNPNGYKTLFWWNGDKWEFSSQYRVLGEKGDGVEDATVNDDGDLIITYTDGVIVNAGHVKGDKGDPLPYSEWSAEDVDKLIQDVNINAQRVPAITAGELPTPPQANMYMVVTDVGAYTYGGATIGTNADGYQTTFWWDGTAWSNNGSVYIKGDMPSGTDTIQSELIPKGKAVESYVNPKFDQLYTLTDASGNLINYLKFVGGVWLKESGNNNVYFTPSDNWVSVEVNSGFEVGDTLFYQGYNNVSGSLHIVICVDNANQATGVFFTTDIESGFVVPPNTAKIYLRVTNATGAGLNPTQIAQRNTAMLSLGNSAKPFEPYFLGVDANKIIGVQPEVISLQEKTLEIEGEIDSFTVKGNQIFDNNLMLGGAYLTGVYSASDNWICTPIMDLDSGKSSITVSGYGTVPITRARFLFFDASNNFISEVLSPATGTGGSVTAIIPALAKRYALNVANVVGIGINPTTSAYANTLMVNYGDSPLPFEPYEDVLYIDGQKIRNLDIPLGFPNSFYQYQPTGASGRPRFLVYSKIKGTDNMYVGYTIDNVYNMSETVYADLYRLMDAKLYSYNGVNMVSENKNIITVGENECTYMQIGKADHTGGYHGDEILEIVRFYANGLQIDTSDAIPLTACDEFYYSQKSTMHEAPNEGNVPVPTHPIQAIHYKHTYFIDGGYTTKNRLVWQQAGLNIAYWYLGLSCIAKDVGTIVENELLQQVITNSDNTTKLSVRGLRKLFYQNSVNNLSSNATSTLLQPVNQDLQCTVFFVDRGDSKYYRRYNPTTTPSINEVWESVMDVRFGIAAP